ncbi:MAG: acetylornithine deacetylase [Pikeienuella sp.]
MSRSVELLKDLIAWPTVSRTPNMALIESARDILVAAGADCQIIAHESGERANLYATIGPKDRGGVMLSGHTDVVPVEGQAWTKDPFALTQEDGRFYGRGTADMKGFVACALAAAELAGNRTLKTPLHIALSYDEEIGCVGVRSMIDMLEQAPIKPALCIVGEPTSMAVATGHKGKMALQADCHGREGHSALAPFAMNALHLAAEFTTEARTIQADIAENGHRDGDYDVPYTTMHVGMIHGGKQINIVPHHAELGFEFRYLAQDDPEALINRAKEAAAKVVAEANDPDARIEITLRNDYPGLDTDKAAEAVTFVKSLTGANGTIKVAFGTEGGLFDQKLGVPTVVCGPGSMNQGHKPDEFVSEEQLARCDELMARLVDRLEVGVT